ncbi:BTAD domain-containing putative transcriptional regulator [Streptomyces sp. NPDC050560]|uniref:AfsR/SARP family transcriptional regulator n=1 Tax=Streptomyces sp. NPDC050560 TaxID=3365630 RepID=UPI0037A793CD
MDIRILGPLSLKDAVDKVAIAPKPRVVLAVLASMANSAVATSALVRELWAEEPPQSATATVQTYVSQLRRSLAEALGDRAAAGAAELIVGEGGGYRLSTRWLRIDLAEYRRLDRLGTEAVESGDFTAGADLLHEALALWTGAPFANVEAGPLIQSQILQLEERRLHTTERRITADLCLGRHQRLVGELRHLVTQHPLHETLHGHLMFALYRCGRRAEALAALRTLRERLVEELGLEPTPRLLRLQQAILTADPALDSPSPDWFGLTGVPDRAGLRRAAVGEG